MIGRVFVLQAPARRTGPSGGWTEKFDLTPAQAFGRIVRVLPYGNVPEDPTPTREAVLKAMMDFDPDEDYVLLLGDPVACAQAIHVLAFDLGIGHLTTLKWDRREEKYFPYKIG